LELRVARLRCATRAKLQARVSVVGSPVMKRC
jgi:hypothetical protein